MTFCVCKDSAFIGRSISTTNLNGEKCKCIQSHTKRGHIEHIHEGVWCKNYFDTMAAMKTCWFDISIAKTKFFFTGPYCVGVHVSNKHCLLTLISFIKP